MAATSSYRAIARRASRPGQPPAAAPSQGRTAPLTNSPWISPRITSATSSPGGEQIPQCFGELHGNSPATGGDEAGAYPRPGGAKLARRPYARTSRRRVSSRDRRRRPTSHPAITSQASVVETLTSGRMKAT